MATLRSEEIDGVWMSVDAVTGAVVGVHEHTWVIMGGKRGLYRCVGCPSWAKDGSDADEQDARQEKARAQIGSRYSGGGRVRTEPFND